MIDSTMFYSLLSFPLHYNKLVNARNRLVVSVEKVLSNFGNNQVVPESSARVLVKWME